MLRTIRRAGVRASLALAIASFGLACGSDSSTSPPAATLAGTWSLKTVNGAALPFVITQSGTDKLEVLGDVYVMTGTGSFTETTTFRSTTNGVATTSTGSDAGTYVLNGSAVSMRWNSDGSTGTASLSGDTMTTSGNGLALVYQR